MYQNLVIDFIVERAVYSMAASSSQRDEVMSAGATSYLTTPEELLNIGAIASGVIHDNQAGAGSTNEASFALALC